MELARLCRRICLQREHEPETCHRSLDEDLANALAIIHSKHGTTAATTDDLMRIYQTEQQRLADAVTLAEVIISKLSPAPSASTANQVEPSPQRAPSSRQEPFPAAPKRPANGTSPGIADLLDGMLAQERPAHAHSSRF